MIPIQWGSMRAPVLNKAKCVDAEKRFLIALTRRRNDLIRIISIFFVFFANLAHAELISGSRFSHGNWTGGAYTDDNTGDFSYCAVSTGYVSGNDLYFALTKDYIFRIGMSRGKGGYTGYTAFPTTITIDRHPSVYPTASVFGDLAIVDMPDMDTALNQIKRGRTLWINSQFGNIPFDLTGTNRVLTKAYDCARRYFNYKGNPAGAAAPEIAEFGQADLFKLATYTLTDLKIADFDFLTDDEISKMLPNLQSNERVFWKSQRSGLIGGVIATHEPNLTDLKQSDSLDLGYLSSLCAGDVLTGALTVKGTEFPMRELVTRCMEDDAVATINATKFKVGEFVVYIVIAAPEAQTVINDPSETSRDLAVKAVKFIKPD